jgi:hypothetical protein
LINTSDGSATLESLQPYLAEYFGIMAGEAYTTFNYETNFGIEASAAPTLPDMIKRMLRVPIGPFSSSGPYELVAYRPASIRSKSLGSRMGMIGTSPLSYPTVTPTRVPTYVELFGIGVPTLRGLFRYWSSRTAALDYQTGKGSLFGNAPGVVPSLTGGWLPQEEVIRLDFSITLGNGQGDGTSSSSSSLARQVFGTLNRDELAMSDDSTSNEATSVDPQDDSALQTHSV